MAQQTSNDTSVGSCSSACTHDTKGVTLCLNIDQRTQNGCSLALYRTGEPLIGSATGLCRACGGPLPLRHESFANLYDFEVLILTS